MKQSKLDLRYPPLTALESAMLAAQAGGVGNFVVRITQNPKTSRNRRVHYQPILKEEQWNNMLANISAGRSKIYGVHRFLHYTIKRTPETLNPV